MSYTYHEYRRNPLGLLGLISFILKFILIPTAMSIAFIHIDIVINQKIESSVSQNENVTKEEVEQQKTKRNSLLFLLRGAVIVGLCLSSTVIVGSFDFYLRHLVKKSLKNEVEALRITAWKNKAKKIPEYIIPDNDTQIVKDKIPWNTNEDILSQYAKYSIPVIFLAETDFPNVLKTMTAPKALEFARGLCVLEHSAFTERNVYAILKEYEGVLQCQLMFNQVERSEQKEK